MSRQVSAVLAAFAIAVLTPAGKTPARVMVDRIVAVVNDEIITLSEVQEMARGQLFGGRGGVRPTNAAERERLERMILEGLIVQKLQVQQARKLGITVSDADVDNAAQEVRARTGLTEEQFIKVIAKQGITYEKYREEIRNRILQERLFNSQVRGKVGVSAEEVRAYYEQHEEEFVRADEVRARVMSMMRNSAAAPERDATFEAMRQLAQLLMQGEDFASLARQFSQDEHASSGGYLGWIGRGMLPAHMEEAVFTLRPGEVSDIMVDERGYYIFQVEEKKGDQVAAFEEVANNILQSLTREKEKRQYEEWMEELRAEAIIENRYPGAE